MDKALVPTVLAWLNKAQHDLIAAKATAAIGVIALDAAIYHCQQAGEKAIKGYLVAQGHPIQKTHDLKVLIPVCASYEPAFAGWMVEAAMLAPLAFMFRYPDDLNNLEPNQGEFDQALDAAQRLFDFVLSRLPPETHPL